VTKRAKFWTTIQLLVYIDIPTIYNTDTALKGSMAGLGCSLHVAVFSNRGIEMPVFPPRPKNRLIPAQLSKYENTGKWFCQRKFNGARNQIHIGVDGKITFWHYGDLHKQWKPSADIYEQVKSLNLNAEGSEFDQGENEYWLDSELLYAKTTDPHYKNRIVIYDVLAYGKYLLGVPQPTRLDLLERICGSPQKLESKHGIALEVTENIWMAQTWEDRFAERFQEFLHLDEIEGLVLRKKKSVLNDTGSKRYEVPWQIRVRKPHKNYNF
jgi:hypothetical protein